jgi:hypothetical protein
MMKLPKIVAVISVIAGVIMIVAGVFTWYVVQRELSDEKITVSDDAENFAGDPVDGPLTAYSQAMVIKEHALDIGAGKTYAELPQDDPKRQTVMNAAFLRASLFTSVVSFGVAALVVGLGVLFILVGLALLGLDKKADIRRLAGIPPEAVISPAAPEAPVLVPAGGPAGAPLEPPAPPAPPPTG